MISVTVDAGDAAVCSGEAVFFKVSAAALGLDLLTPDLCCRKEEMLPVTTLYISNITDGFFTGLLNSFRISFFLHTQCHLHCKMFLG